MNERVLNRVPHYLYAHYLYAKYRTRLVLGIEHADRIETGEFPLPPLALRYRVHGSIKPDSFLRVGRRCAADIEALLRDGGFRFPEFLQVLDFGCGCGRVLRFLARDRATKGTLHGTDIDSQAIRWCTQHLPFAHWSVNDALPPTRYGPNAFDFVFAISVFTHLDERLQLAWLSEILRILKPNGLLLATVHGEQYVDQVKKEHMGVFDATGILNQVGRTGALKLDGLPDYYQTTFHSRNYIERVWGKMFEVLSYKEKGMNERQDAVLLRKRAGS